MPARRKRPPGVVLYWVVCRDDVRRQLLFPFALTHDNCYRADGRCLMKMLPVLDGENRGQIEGATEFGKQTRIDPGFGGAIRREHAKPKAADSRGIHEGYRISSKACNPRT
jgi:hypothetical protein